MSGKREEYISWDGFFMGIAALASFRSKDPSTQNGACIVDMATSNILSIGYNGFPRGCCDDVFPWAREAENKEDTKYPYVEHSERNAIYNAVRNGIKLEGSVLYLYSEKGYYPCDECARAIIQSGIKRVVLAFAITEDTDVYSWGPTKKMFISAGVTMDVISDSPCRQERNLSIIKDFNLISEKMSEVAGKLS